MAKPNGKAGSCIIFLLILAACVQLPAPEDSVFIPPQTASTTISDAVSGADAAAGESGVRHDEADHDDQPLVVTVEDSRQEPAASADSNGVVGEGGKRDESGAGVAGGRDGEPLDEQGAMTGNADLAVVTRDPAPGVAADLETDKAVPVRKSPRRKASLPVMNERHQEYVKTLCEQVGNTLGSVSVDDCLAQRFNFGGGFSTRQRPLVVKDFPPAEEGREPIRVFLMGGIHGDEYSSISIIFKWLELFSPRDSEGDFHWRFAPLVNPDGLLDEGEARRQNANGVDLNRNFPSLDWNDHASDYWVEETGRNPRRFPGESAASEPEVQWVVRQIEEFNPDVIVSVHAPYHLLDFDGPSEAPDKIGELYLHQLGVYPGSLGNYAGIDKRIPVVTLELPSAGILPTREQIRLMWLDLVTWLDNESRKSLASN